MTTLIHSTRKLDADGQVDDFWVLLEAGSIKAVGTGPVHPPADTVVDAGGDWLTPGFIDLHGHGGGGFSYDQGAEQLFAALATHRAHGTTRSVLSLVAAPIESLLENLALIADLTQRDPLVLGSHLEGPYLAPAHRGAHNPAYLREPDPSDLEEFISASRGTLRQVTLAAELPNAFEAVDVLVESGIVVALGHTDATFEMAKEAFDRGVRLLTHAFNAMPGIHHRSPGPVVAAFEDERVVLELVCDGVHVHPDVVNLSFASAAGRIALITDSMAAAGSEDGNYRLGNLNVTVRDGKAVLSGTNTIAGSTLTQDEALGCAIAAGVDPAKAVEALTHTPARVLGLEKRHGMLAPGFAADAVLLDNDWSVTGVWADGIRL